MNSFIKKAAALALVLIMTVGSFSAFADAQKFTFTDNQHVYSIGMDSAAAFATLGTANGSRDVNNCANGYVNKAYTYGKTDKDYEVYIEQNAAHTQEIVAGITLLTPNVATEEGLKVGDSAEKVLSVYPTAKKGLGSYTVEKGGVELQIKMRANAVSYIAYRAVG